MIGLGKRPLAEKLRQVGCLSTSANQEREQGRSSSLFTAWISDGFTEERILEIVEADGVSSYDPHDKVGEASSYPRHGFCGTTVFEDAWKIF
jgi:hypothetical protein